MGAKKSDMSVMLYNLMLSRGYSEPFSDLITQSLHTDFTASKMIGYLSHYEHPPMEEIADEMLSILALRDGIVEKKTNEHANAVWNEYLWRGLGIEPEEEGEDEEED